MPMSGDSIIGVINLATKAVNVLKGKLQSTVRLLHGIPAAFYATPAAWSNIKNQLQFKISGGKSQVKYNSLTLVQTWALEDLYMNPLVAVSQFWRYETF